MFTTVPLTPELVIAYYGEPKPYTIRGRALLRDGELVGVFGIYEDQGLEIQFSDVKEGVWPKPPSFAFKRVIVDAIRAIHRLQKPGEPIYAYADPSQSGSDVMLEHFGYEQIKERAYRWP